MASFVETVNKVASLIPANVEDLNLIVQNIDAINAVTPLANDLNDIINNIVPNLTEILEADNNATIATEQALLATTNGAAQVALATAQAVEASTSASNALASEVQAGIYAGQLDPSKIVAKDSTTGSAMMPAGTTAQRPISPSNGYMRYNTDLLKFEGYQGGVWSTLGGLDINTLTAKTTPLDDDEIGLIDSASTFTLKKLTWANLKATLKTYFDTLYVSLSGNQTIAGVKNFTSYPTVNGVALGSTQLELTSNPMIGLLYNSTDDTYKRIGKNINTLTLDGFNEFTAWRSPTAERQNDNDTVSASPLTAWLDTSANLPFSFMKRYVISNLGAEVKEYNATSFAHADQTGVTATQQVMVKIPKFNYIQAKIVDGGKTYYLYAIATASFTLNALTELGFISPTITVWNPTAGVSSGTVASNVLTSALHPAFTDNASNVMNQRYYGAFNAVSGRSICGSTIKPTGAVTLAQCRTACQGFGTGFTQLDFFLESAKNILALIERGSHYFERGGTSLANKWEGYSWNTGGASIDQDNGLTLSLLNKTGVILDGSNRTIANSYRGIENYHSCAWRWVDGVSLSANLVYLAKPKATFSDGTITTPYFSSGYTVPAGASASYIQDFGAGSFIPTVLGGSASTKVTDAAWTGSTALCVGGGLFYPSTSGLATWSSNNAASSSAWTIVARSGL